MSDTKATTKKKKQNPVATTSTDDGPAAVNKFKQRLVTVPWIQATVRLPGQLSARLKALWVWVKLNKVKLMWTAILVATVLGSGISIYIWRRELETLIRLAWGKFWRWLGEVFQRETVVIVAESVNQAGVNRVVKRSAATTAGNGTGA